MKCKEVIKCMNELAPPELALKWDNIGLLVGDEDTDIKNILVALDATENVIDEAIRKKCDMIITHHPLIFKPMGCITNNNPLGKKVFKLIKNNISLFSAHTNLDIAANGTNDTFAKMLNLQKVEHLLEPVSEDCGMGKVGILDKEMKFSELVSIVKEFLEAESLVVSGDIDRVVRKIGICTGKASSFDYMNAAKKKGCDVYITGDVGYHDAQNANELDLCLIDATHYYSEVIVVPVVCNYLRGKLNGVNCICSELNEQNLNII